MKSKMLFIKDCQIETLNIISRSYWSQGYIHKYKNGNSTVPMKRSECCDLARQKGLTATFK